MIATARSDKLAGVVNVEGPPGSFPAALRVSSGRHRGPVEGRDQLCRQGMI